MTHGPAKSQALSAETPSGTPADPGSPAKGGRRRTAFLFTPAAQLAGVAVATWLLFLLIPLSQTVSRQPAFLFAHGTSRGNWLLVMAGACLVAVAAFILLAWCLSAISRRASLAVAAIPAAALALVPLWGATQGVVGKGAWPLTLLLAAIATATLLFIARRTNLGVPLLLLAACAVPAVTWVGLFQPVAEGQASGGGRIAWSETLRERPNVLLIVVDEGSAAAMMDRTGAVRPGLRNLVDLQRRATTYTRAFGTYPFTDVANPAIASGLSNVGNLNETGLARLRLGESPLLAGLSSKYDLWLYDATGINCRTFPCRASRPGKQEAGTGLLAKDTAAVVGDQLLPEPLARAFPDTKGSFSNFWRAEEVDPSLHELPRDVPWNRWGPGGKPWFYLLHTLRAHHPWDLGQDGKPMFPRKANAFPDAYLMGACRESGVFCTNRLVNLARARYANSLLQVDRDLGRVLRSLKDSGEWDETLVIVTADHSVAFRRNTDGRRPATLAAKAELAWVPLIVRRPGQAKAQFVTEPRSTGQVLPSVIESAGGRVVAGLPSPPLSRPAAGSASFTPVAPGTEGERVRSLALPDLSRRVKPWPDLFFRYQDESRYSPGLPVRVGSRIGNPVPRGWQEARLDKKATFVSEGRSRYAGVQLVTTDERCWSGGDPVGLLANTQTGRVVAGIAWEAPAERGGTRLRGWAIVRRADGRASGLQAFCRA